MGQAFQPAVSWPTTSLFVDHLYPTACGTFGIPVRKILRGFIALPLRLTNQTDGLSGACGRTYATSDTPLRLDAVSAVVFCDGIHGASLICASATFFTGFLVYHRHKVALSSKIGQAKILCRTRKGQEHEQQLQIAKLSDFALKV